jgi:BirA family biotin operon repressor/biotin-[acetyl-CoA-carboxylase] ligase
MNDPVETSVSFGRPRRHFRLTGSTNDEARVLAEAGAPCGAIVSADEQDAGRGRHGRSWSAPPGAALLCSAIVRPLGPEHSLLPLAVPLAVCDAVESLGVREAEVKWPNDVWVADRKVAGVLIEARPPSWAVIGVGINLSIADDEFPDDLRWPATSVGGDVGPEAALTAMNETLGHWVAAGVSEVIGTFERRDALRGREISWDGGGEPRSGFGVAAGIDERGNLLVETAVGERRALGSGEVSVRVA